MNQQLEYPEIERRQDILSLAINQCSEGIAVIDLEGNLLYVNDAFAEMHGYSPSDILGKHFSIFHTPEQMQSVDAANRELREKGVFKGEIWHKRADGSVFPAMMHNTIVKNDNGKPIAMIGTMRDISEQRRAENELRKSEEKYRLLADNVADVIWTMDMNMNYTYFSPSITLLQGFTVEEALSLSIEESMTSNSFKRVMGVISEEMEMLNSGQKPDNRVRKIEVELNRKDGSTVWAEVEGNFIYNANGQPEGIIGVTRDITERKKAEKALLEAKSDLEEKVKNRTAELNEKNITLKVLMEQRKEERLHLEEVIMSNVKRLVMPNISRLKNSKLSSKQQTALSILEGNLNEIVSPFSKTIDSNYMKLTPTEIQVANFIKHGASSKDISESLALSQRTVDTHRYNIRKKLGIRGKGVNLRTYLSSM